MAGVKAPLEIQGCEVKVESEAVIAAGLIRGATAVDPCPKSLAVVDRRREEIAAVQAQGKKLINKIGVSRKIAGTSARSKDLFSPKIQINKFLVVKT